MKTKSSAFNTCLAFVPSMPLNKVMRLESELSEQPSYILKGVFIVTAQKRCAIYSFKGALLILCFLPFCSQPCSLGLCCVYSFPS